MPNVPASYSIIHLSTFLVSLLKLTPILIRSYLLVYSSVFSPHPALFLIRLTIKSGSSIITKRLPSVRQKTEMLPVWNSGYDRLPPSFITFRYARENLLINVTITFIISKTHTPVKVGNMAGNLSTTGGEHAVAYSPLRAVSPTLSIRYTVPQGGFSVLPGRCGTHCNTGSALNFRPFYLAIGLGTHRDFTANLFVVQAFATYQDCVLEQFQVVAKLQVDEFLIQILSHL